MLNKDPGSVEDPALRGEPGFELPLEGVVCSQIFVGVLEPALVRRPTKKHLELLLCKGNALKVVRANPSLDQGVLKSKGQKPLERVVI